MARITHEGTKVYWLTTIANTSAPTVAEINAGVDLTSKIPVDGISVNPTRNNASQAMLGDSFVAELVGTWGQGVTITFVRDDTTDTPRTTFGYKTAGYLVISRFGTPSTGKKVEVYPAQSHLPADLASAENEFAKYEVQLAVTAAPVLTSTIA